MFITGYMEMLICAIICASKLTEEDFTGGNGSDVFSSLFLIISIITLAVLPIFIFVFLKRNFDELDKEETM
jgi:hypothetical protein